MAVTVKIKKKNEYLRLTKAEANKLVQKGKARFADKNEWRRWLERQESNEKDSQ